MSFGPESHRNYHQRFKRVLAYIDDRLDDELDLTKLAEIASFSKFHFQRQFSAYLGISASEYIRQLRLERSAHMLAFRRIAICDIAFDCHFSSQEAYSRAFKKHFGVSPFKFRKATPWEAWCTRSYAVELRSKLMISSTVEQQVTVVEFPTTPIAVLSHYGDPSLVMQTVARFVEWRRAQGNLSPSVSDTFNIMYDDPNNVPTQTYRFDIACSVNSPVSENTSNVVNATIEGGRCAKLNVTGSNDDLAMAIHSLYGEWLPQTNYQCRDTPLFVKRVAMYPEVALHQQVFEVYLPLC